MQHGVKPQASVTHNVGFVIVKDEKAYIFRCAEEYDSALKSARAHAKRHGIPVYVDMNSNLPSTPWVVWCDVMRPGTKSFMYVRDLDSVRDNVCQPPPPPKTKSADSGL